MAGTLIAVCLTAVLVHWAAAVGGQAPRDATALRTLSVVQWNVENLFDTHNDPDNDGDDSFTPDGWRHWNETRYRLKLRHLAEMLRELDGDIVCLQEVENRRVLDDLCDLLRREMKVDYPHILHREGPDHRGIDVAILSTVKPTDCRWLTPVQEQRDILIAKFAPGGSALVVMVNHWKSRVGPQAKATSMRTRQAQAARAELDRILKDSPRSAIMVVGDFNDDFDGLTITNVLMSSTDIGNVEADPKGRILYNLHAGLPENRRGSFYYRGGKRWNTFDSISVSRAMVLGDAPGWRVRDGSYDVVRPVAMSDDAGTPVPFRIVKNKATGKHEYVTGYSDHYPVKVVLDLP